MEFHLSEPDYLYLVALSFVFTFALLAARLFFERRIHEKHDDWSEEQRLKAVGTIRNGTFAVLFIGLMYIWGGVIRDFAVSVFAIALAVVVATKELILCVHGYILILRNRPYELGDRIEVGGKRGDVTNINVLSTTVLEVGPIHNSHQRTGRQISFPNSMLLTHFVYNESAFEDFALITISVPLYMTDDWEQAKAILLEKAHQQCAPYLDNARRRGRSVQRRTGLELPSVDPRVHVDITSPKRLVLQLRLPCPFHLRERIEQAVITEFLKNMAKIRTNDPLDDDDDDDDDEDELVTVGGHKLPRNRAKIPVVG